MGCAIFRWPLWLYWLAALLPPKRKPDACRANSTSRDCMNVPGKTS